MFTFFSKLIAGVALAFSSLFHPASVGSTLPVTSPAIFETYLANQMGTTDTSLTLASGSTFGGGTLTGTVCLTIDQNTSQLEYVCGTAAGTSVTGLSRGVYYTGTGIATSSTLAFTHRRGADVKVTDYPVLPQVVAMLNGQDTIPNKLSYTSSSSINVVNDGDLATKYYVDYNEVSTGTAQTVTGSKIFTASTTYTGVVTFNVPPISVTDPSGSTQVANKHYVDGVAVAGAPNASSTVKGIVQEATQADIVAGNATGTTGARLYINPISIAVSGANKIPLLDANGLLNSSTYSPPSYIDNTAVNVDGPEQTGHPSSVGTTTGMRIGDSGAAWYLYDPIFSTYGFMSKIPAIFASSSQAEASAVNIGNQIYVEEQDNTSALWNFVFSNYNRTNLASTSVTFSGQTIGTQTGDRYVQMSTDGTNIYINYDTRHSTNSCIIDKYSVSGSTFTFTSSTTLAAGGGSNCAEVLYVSPTTGNYYTGGQNQPDGYLRVYSSTGTALATSSAQYNGVGQNGSQVGEYNINNMIYLSTQNVSSGLFTGYGAINLK